jgi:hypothetical protein
LLAPDNYTAFTMFAVQQATGASSCLANAPDHL